VAIVAGSLPGAMSFEEVQRERGATIEDFLRGLEIRG